MSKLPKPKPEELKTMGVRKRIDKIEVQKEWDKEWGL